MNEQRTIKKSNNVKQGVAMSSKEYQEEQQHWARNSKKTNTVKQEIARKVVVSNKE